MVRCAPLTKTHVIGGLFHNVVKITIQAAEGRTPPEDLYALTSETVDLFRTLTTKQLEAMDMGRVSFMRHRRLKAAQEHPTYSHFLPFGRPARIVPQCELRDFGSAKELRMVDVFTASVLP